jgi:DNA-binding MarR family transcriptional regulator
MTSEPSVAECLDCLCLASRRASRAITRAYDRELRSTGVRVTQFSLLVLLIQRGSAPIGELAEFLGTERTTLTRNLALLEEAGWVEIRPGEDARARIVSITKKGRAAAFAALPAWRKAQRKALAVIGASGSGALLRLAQRPIQ